MLNIPLIYRAIGSLLYLEALLLSICFGMSLFYQEANLWNFGTPILVAVAVGSLLLFFGRHAENHMSRRDGYLIVSLTWVVFSLVGMLPFIVGGYQPRIAAAFFETISGFTTSGATVLNHIDALPHSIQTWRSMTHWIGGMGIVFFTIAILPNMGGSESKLFSAEVTGLKIGKLHPRISTTARWMWSLYFMLTLSCMVAYYLGGMSLYDAFNHGLSTIGTGGFSTHQDSIAYFHSVRLEWITGLFMFLAGINCTMLYLLFVKRRIHDVLHDEELRFYAGLMLAAVGIVTGVLYFANDFDFLTALRNAFFNVTSLQSTTGFTNADFMTWHPVTWIVLTLVGIVGACSGSTSGGLKCVRVLIVAKLTRTEFRQLLHPHAVLPVRVNHSQITPQLTRTIFILFVTAFLLILTAVTAMAAMGIPLLDATGLAITSFSNVGPCVGHFIGPVGTWDRLNDASLCINAFLMLAGRLEVFSLLLPFTPSFWKDK